MVGVNRDSVILVPWHYLANSDPAVFTTGLDRLTDSTRSFQLGAPISGLSVQYYAFRT